MTVEDSSYMDVVKDTNEGEFCDNVQNNENIYPLGGELMVAIRPLIQNCNIPLMSKINIKKSREAHDKFEKEILSNSNDKEILLDSKLSPPLKKTSVDITPPCKESPRKPKMSSALKRTSSLAQPLSHSADSGQLQTALKHVQDNLSQSCFAELTSEKGKGSDIDSELTCLNWLQESNLLKEFSPAKKKGGESSTDESGNSVTKRSGCNLDLKLNAKDPLSSIGDIDKSSQKPAYSFSTLIFMAIESSPNKRLPVKDIYQWIQDNFAYFQSAPIGWKNSIRHNLSLNKSFKKVDKEKCIGKGSLWMIDHQARAGLVQQLRKTSMCNSYPYSKPPYTNGCSRYFLKDKKLHRRDSTGRFVPNHDDAEFDVAAAMCSLSSSTLLDYQNDCIPKRGFDYVSSEELLQIWRTCIEPNEEEGDEEEHDVTDHQSNSFIKRNRLLRDDSKYSIKDFLDVVQSKLSTSRSNNRQDGSPSLDSSLNISMDEDYEFDRSDDESSDDDEMRENMLRLVEKENDECLADSGYSEEGTLKHASSSVLDHSYSKSIQSLVRPHTKRESKGVDALLHLANAATRELELLNRNTDNKMDCSSSSNNSRPQTPTSTNSTHACAMDVQTDVQTTAEVACQFNSTTTFGVTTMS